MAPSPARLEIAGAKVTLCRFAESDITERYTGWLNDPVTMRYSNQRFVRHDRDSSLKYLRSFEGSSNHFFSVRDSLTGQAIGTMTAYLSPHHGTADMGILIGERPSWGQGYGLDAWRTLMAWLLARPGTRKVTAGTLACNAPMLKLMHRSGMLPDGVRRHQELVDGKPQDILYFARFRDA